MTGQYAKTTQDECIVLIVWKNAAFSTHIPTRPLSQDVALFNLSFILNTLKSITHFILHLAAVPPDMPIKESCYLCARASYAF